MLRCERVRQRLRQADVAANAGIALTAVRRLELGSGATVHTLAAVVRALGKTGWWDSLAPAIGVDPMEMLRRLNRLPYRVRRRKDDGR
jgi:transcriptional regulator with XRE-family HTH domain